MTASNSKAATISEANTANTVAASLDEAQYVNDTRDGDNDDAADENPVETSAADDNPTAEPQAFPRVSFAKAVRGKAAESAPALSNRDHLNVLRRVSVEGHTDSESEGPYKTVQRMKRKNSSIHRNRLFLAQRQKRETRGGLITGTRGGTHVKARHHSDHNRGGREATGLFVSRLPEDFTGRDLAAYIEEVSRYRVSCKMLQTKHSGYASCFVRASQYLQEKLMRPDLWPSGVIVRPYLE